MIRTILILAILLACGLPPALPLAAPSSPLTALVTGSTSGIGLHTAQRFASSGHRVIIHGRTQEKVDSALATLEALEGTVEHLGVVGDLCTIAGCRSVASKVLSLISCLDILVNNCGVFETDLTLTSDNLEKTFAVNVLSPHIITTALLPILPPKSRIAFVSSISMADGSPTINFDDLQFFNKNYDKYEAYGHSKRLTAMYAKELSRRLSPAEESPLVISCDPGTVNTAMLRKGWGSCGVELDRADNEFLLSTMEWDEKYHGDYFVGCRKTIPHQEVNDEEKGRKLFGLLEALLES